MLKIGLTGGIGSGKSAAAREFAALGVPVIDTDRIARELVTPGSPLLDRIAEHFGPDILTAAGALDRAALRRHVFADPAARQRLEAILHPPILAEMQRRAEAETAPYVILVIPLLAETGAAGLVDRVLVVDVPEDLQRQRVAARDNLTDAEIDAILAAQCKRDARLKIADDIIDNSGELAALRARVHELHEKYLTLATRRSHRRGPAA